VTWARYYDASNDEPRETLLYALERFGDRPGRLAVDLGCGAGRDAAELLRRGWHVLAIDSEEEGLERLRARPESGPALETRRARLEEAKWPTADLVNSSFALPFCAPDRFPEVWARVFASLPPGGRFSGQLFGDRDEWAADGLTVHTRAEAEALLADFELERFDEVEEDGRTALGAEKHWHIFHVVARKR
jgi:SAM-dependent methyltransferase